MVTEAVPVQPLRLVAVTVYVPALKFVIVAPVPEGLHVYVKFPLAPLAVAAAAPFAPPKQDTFVGEIETEIVTLAHGSAPH
jgi:hypothetical protein